MKRILLAAVLALAWTGAASARPHPQGEPYWPAVSSGPYQAFDVRNARTWAERLVLCDTTAFLAGEPNLNADRMWVRREGRRPELLLPPYFVGPGRWYREGYQRLFWRLRARGLVTDPEVYRAQDTLLRRFVDTYRRINPYAGGAVDSGFLQAQDRDCRRMGRDQGEIID